MTQWLEHPLNQSKEHLALSKKAIIWGRQMATGRGYRANLEQPVGGGVVVDALILSCLQSRYRERYDTAADALDFALVFESKVSRSDFFRTFKNEESGRLNYIGSLHWVITPKALVDPSEVPEWWGLLQPSKNGRGLREVKRPPHIHIGIDAIHRLSYFMLWNAPKRNYASKND